MSVPENGRIRVSTGKIRIRLSTEELSGRVMTNDRISVIAGKWKNPSEYREKVEPFEYRKAVRTSIEKF